MKYSVALLLLLVRVGPSFSNVHNNNASTHSSVSTLVGRDDNGKLVPLDQNDTDTEDIEVTRRNLRHRVKFYLHTVKNPRRRDAQQLWVNDLETLSQSYFDPLKPTRFVTHGWLHSSRSASCRLVRKAYLKHGDYNVIVVDWSKISVSGYVRARNRVKIVGEYVGQMIDFLALHGMNTLETIVVGHSLGGHIAGIAARHAINTVGHVVALDPALPLFVFAKPGDRVGRGDANYVQVIHTNAGVLGYADPIGDVDFYPNGGYKQPGCDFIVHSICSHYGAFRFFAESINSKAAFVGTECEDYSKYISGKCHDNNKDIMGGPEPTVHATGSYYLVTNRSPPYAKES